MPTHRPYRHDSLDVVAVLPTRWADARADWQPLDDTDPSTGLEPDTTTSPEPDDNTDHVEADEPDDTTEEV